MDNTMTNGLANLTGNSVRVILTHTIPGIQGAANFTGRLAWADQYGNAIVQNVEFTTGQAGALAGVSELYLTAGTYVLGITAGAKGARNVA